MSWIELVAQRRSPTPPGLEPPKNAADWYKITNSASDSDSTDVYVYSDIGGWFGIYADEFIHDFKNISSKRINLRLNSPGGSVFEGIAIANTIRSHPAHVTVYVDGLAASIASIIALSGNKIVMMPQSQLMIHDASGMCYGNAAEMEYMVGLLNKQSENIAEAYADKAGGTAAEWRELMKAETWYTAKEAVTAGLADEVAKAPEPEEEGQDEEDDSGDEKAQKKMRNASSWDLAAMFRYAGRGAAPAPRQIKNVMRQFDEGDKVAALVKHEPEHTVGRIAVVNGNAYGVIWENPDDDTMETGTEVYRWYTDDELQWLEGGADHDEDEDEAGEPTEETLLPGVSHPNGMPLPPHAEYKDGKIVVSLDIGSSEFQAHMREMIRQTIRDELAVVEGTACPSHSTAVKAGTWDAGANEGRLTSPVPVATVKKMYAYYDEEKVEDGAVPKGSCKLPHHFVSSDGTPGAASVNAVRNALARLPQTKGLSEQERSAAEAHLRKHLDAFPGGDEEAHADDELDAHANPHVDDASKRSTPSPPEEEEEPDEAEEEEPDEEPDEENDEPDDKTSVTDSWADVIAHLSISPSPSADDVFTSIREAW